MTQLIKKNMCRNWRKSSEELLKYSDHVVSIPNCSPPKRMIEILNMTEYVAVFATLIMNHSQITITYCIPTTTPKAGLGRFLQGPPIVGPPSHKLPILQGILVGVVWQ